MGQDFFFVFCSVSSTNSKPFQEKRHIHYGCRLTPRKINYLPPREGNRAAHFDYCGATELFNSTISTRQPTSCLSDGSWTAKKKASPIPARSAGYLPLQNEVKYFIFVPSENSKLILNPASFVRFSVIRAPKRSTLRAV